MISEDEVKRIAKLARMGLTSKELEKMRKELSSILDYIKKLKEVDVSRVEPISRSIKIKNIMRKDEGNEKLKMKNEKLLKLAPKTKNGYLKVKSIF